MEDNKINFEYFKVIEAEGFSERSGTPVVVMKSLDNYLVTSAYVGYYFVKEGKIVVSVGETQSDFYCGSELSDDGDFISKADNHIIKISSETGKIIDKVEAKGICTIGCNLEKHPERKNIFFYIENHSHFCIANLEEKIVQNCHKIGNVLYGFKLLFRDYLIFPFNNLVYLVCFDVNMGSISDQEEYKITDLNKANLRQSTNSQFVEINQSRDLAIFFSLIEDRKIGIFTLFNVVYSKKVKLRKFFEFCFKSEYLDEVTKSFGIREKVKKRKIYSIDILTRECNKFFLRRFIFDRKRRKILVQKKVNSPIDSPSVFHIFENRIFCTNMGMKLYEILDEF